MNRETFTGPVVALGRATVSAVSGIGYAGMLLLESLYFAAVGWRIGQPLRIRSVFEQMRQIGVDALPIVTMLALTIGIMLGIQFISALSEFGALITAILVAGRSGSALAARIGSMSVSQEVDALATMGIEPVRYLAAPALLAMLLMLPLLTVFADVVAIVGAALYSSPALNVTPAAYLSQTLALLAPGDIWQGVSKAFVFAVLITLIGVSTGFSVSGGAEGVGRATTRSVVLAICYIIVADMIFSFFLNR